MTTEEFWRQLGTYNAATWPVQLAWLVATLIVTYLVLAKRTAWANIAMKILLAFVFAWNGVVFFLIFSDGPVYDFFFAPLFIAIAVLFVVDIFVKRIVFGLPDKQWRIYATLCWVVLWLFYPFVGVMLGRSFPKVCTPMNPCPSTVLAIALVVAAIPKVERKVYIALLPWALMGLPKCLGVFACHEDCILFAAGVYGLVMLIANWHIIGQASVA